MILVVSSFSKSSVFKIFFVHMYTVLNAKGAFSNSSGFKSVFGKLRFLDGLGWTVGLTVEIKLRFQIPSAQRVQGPQCSSVPFDPVMIEIRLK